MINKLEKFSQNKQQKKMTEMVAEFTQPEADIQQQTEISSIDPTINNDINNDKNQRDQEETDSDYEFEASPTQGFSDSTTQSDSSLIPSQIDPVNAVAPSFASTSTVDPPPFSEQQSIPPPPPNPENENFEGEESGEKDREGKIIDVVVRLLEKRTTSSFFHPIWITFRCSFLFFLFQLMGICFLFESKSLTWSTWVSFFWGTYLIWTDCFPESVKEEVVKLRTFASTRIIDFAFEFDVVTSFNDKFQALCCFLAQIDCDIFQGTFHQGFNRGKSFLKSRFFKDDFEERMKKRLTRIWVWYGVIACLFGWFVSGAQRLVWFNTWLCLRLFQLSSLEILCTIKDILKDRQRCKKNQTSQKQSNVNQNAAKEIETLFSFQIARQRKEMENGGQTKQIVGK